MAYLLALSPAHYFFSISLGLTSLFLILVVLVQRGRGGGLTGALGGMGGQSAFGTKAGDLFTRITIVVATIWILLAIGALKVLNRPLSTENASSSPTVPAPKGTTGEQPPATTSTGDTSTGSGDSQATTAPAEPANTEPAKTEPAKGEPAADEPADTSKK